MIAVQQEGKAKLEQWMAGIASNRRFDCIGAIDRPWKSTFPERISVRAIVVDSGNIGVVG